MWQLLLSVDGHVQITRINLSKTFDDQCGNCVKLRRGRRPGLQPPTVQSQFQPNTDYILHKTEC